MSDHYVEYIAYSEADLPGAVDLLLRFAEGRRKIALTGGLGAGKTAFVKAFCRRMQVEDAVSSPTFALVNEYVYEGENGQEEPLFHLDLYRLRSIEEALGIGIEEYLDGPHYCLIEWPEIIVPLLPEDAVFVNIEVLDDQSRKVAMSYER